MVNYKNKVKKRISPISLDHKINYKDINLLKTFINEDLFQLVFKDLDRKILGKNYYIRKFEKKKARSQRVAQPRPLGSKP